MGIGGEGMLYGSVQKKRPWHVAPPLVEEETSLSVLLIFVPAFSAVIWVTVGVVVEVHFVHGFNSLGQIVLEGRDSRAQRWGPETVWDETEVGQTALNSWFKDGLRPGVSKRRAVLGQQVCELFADLP